NRSQTLARWRGGRGMTERNPRSLGDDVRRAVVYVIFDRRGMVEEYVVHALREMRGDASHILAVVNSELTEEGRARLENVADDILVRPNVGFDILGHKAGLERLGDGIAAFDEIVLTNDTWFGPVNPYREVLDPMSKQPVHFWGMTDNVRMKNPATGTGRVPDHLQSFWIAVRREMFLSEEWAQYWSALPQMDGYFDAVL